MSELAAHIVAGAVRATDRIIGYAFREAAFGGLSLAAVFA
jgi:hypothetical protein